MRIDLAYDGTDFSGWASQPGLRTVQGELERWITQVLRLQHPAQLVVAGRTDAGVHASGQVCHLDLPEGCAVELRDGRRPSVDSAEGTDLVRQRLDRVLPEDILVRRVQPVGDAFDARFSAVWRRYCYRLWDDQTCTEPSLRRRAATVRGRLDVGAMSRAGEVLLGLHDFAAFCKPREGATTIRTLQQVVVERQEDGEVTIRLQADAFCHSMVRSLVGALSAIGQHRTGRDEDWLALLLQATQRDSSVLMMPARGLTLTEVGYPTEDQWAARAVQARRRRDEES